MKKLWYNFFKLYISTGLFFYTKKIKIVGKENIPKKGAVLFAVNHPNGLLDPLLVTTNTPRITHYLVRAAVFKKPIIKKLLSTLNLMPIYRIRDGVKELSKNKQVFNDCFEILNKQSTLMIFPEGSHNKRRSVRILSKGFTRILFGALDMYPELKINIIPVGVTYQNASQYPCKVAIHYGKPILANEYYTKSELNKSITVIKEKVATQLKELSVHIPLDKDYQTTVDKLNTNNVDFTNVADVNSMISLDSISKQKKTINPAYIFYFIIVLNSIIPWALWKLISKKIDETEFIDTFRFGVGAALFPLFYCIQTYIVYYFYSLQIAGIYFTVSLLIVLLYSKLSTTPTE